LSRKICSYIFTEASATVIDIQ